MATMKKAAPKAQKGKKVDGNTNAQKLMLDNKYNSVYRSMQNDSIKASNRSLPSTYEKLRRANAGKSPSAAKLRSAQDKLNKSEVKSVNSPDKLVSSKDPKGKQKMEIRENIRKALKKTQGKSPLDARGRTEEVMKKFAMNSYKSGGVVKKKMKNGGSLTGLKASTKRDNGIDPKGAFTKVQKKTLAGARGKASLTKDKQLGATKMAKKGMSIKKK